MGKETTLREATGFEPTAEAAWGTLLEVDDVILCDVARADEVITDDVTGRVVTTADGVVDDETIVVGACEEVGLAVVVLTGVVSLLGSGAVTMAVLYCMDD